MLRTVMRRARTVLLTVFCLAVLLKVWRLLPGGRADFFGWVEWPLAGRDLAFSFALEALFFRNGELRSTEEIREIPH